MPEGQLFNPALGPPRLPEDMVPFYESYIPVKLEGQPERIAAALEALAERDQVKLEEILNPWAPPGGPAEVDPQSGLSEEEEIALLTELGFDLD
jgi:hypothetical protein